jgi:hypothetical protein
MALIRTVLLAIVSCVLLLPMAARAQDAGNLPRAAVFPTANSEPGLGELASALDPVVLAKLGDLQIVQVSTRPGLDLPAAEIAIDCVGETRECLSAMAQQVGAPMLIAPSVQRAGEETVVTILRFDAAAEGDIRTVVRRFDGGDVTAAALDAVPSMLRELFGLPEPSAESVVQEPQPTAPPETSEPVDVPEHPFPVAPVVMTAVGVALLATGAVFAMASQQNKDDYAHKHVPDNGAVDDAIKLREKAKHQATLANIGFGAGAAIAAVGLTWLVIDLTSQDEVDQTSATLAPLGGPGRFGLALQGHFARNAW